MVSRPHLHFAWTQVASNANTISTLENQSNKIMHLISDARQKSGILLSNINTFHSTKSNLLKEKEKPSRLNSLHWQLASEVAWVYGENFNTFLVYFWNVDFSSSLHFPYAVLKGNISNRTEYTVWPCEYWTKSCDFNALQDAQISAIYYLFID